MPSTSSGNSNFGEFDVGSMEGASLTASANSRQKRVMPSRSRRGGPGLGQCEVDNLILETQRRKLENEPLIPGDTSFLLTTNPKYAQETLNGSDLGIQINIVANDRYFDRPDVLKAFRQQTIIQTPDYEAISDSISGVGGRFRPRNQDETLAETSDAAYEKRHRKFENFEKRQRLREKEKLKHEHYKLKERIEQLRGMDGAAFTTLPASAFSPAPPGGDDNEELTGPFVGMNGGVYHPEGERRRKEMLDIALKLEQRYAYLLPPERPRKGQEVSSSKETESRDDSDDEQDSGIVSRKDSVLKLRMQSAKSSASSSSAPSPAALKSVMLRKSSVGSQVEPTQPPYLIRNLRRNSTPACAASAQPFLPSESLPEPSSPSPEIDVETHEIPPPTFFQPPPPPPLPSQFVWSLHASLQTPTVNVSSLPFQQPQHPLGPPAMHVILHDENVSMEPNEMHQHPPGPPAMHWVLHDENVLIEPNEVHRPEGKAKEKTPVQTPPPADIHINGESEKAPSEPEDALQEESQPRTRGGQSPEGVIDSVEILSATTAKGDDPPIVVPRSLPRGRKSKRSLLEISQAETERPKTRVMQTRLQEANLAESSKRVEEHDKQRNSTPEEAPVADEVTESISTRPIKRRRRKRDVLDESAAVPSDQVSDRGAPISATATSVRGKTFVTYVDSRTGEAVCTPSLLMIACVRAAEKFNIRKARETTSFGVPTPDFGKGAIVDYELQEEILYRNLRDKSQTAGPENGVEQPPGEEDHEPPEQEERLMEGDGEVHRGDDAAEQTDEEEVNLGDNEQFSIRSRGSGMHDGEVAKEAVQPHPSQEIEERFSYGPPIILSPEPDPLSPDLRIEVHPGVRPREPSRHMDDEDELLEW